MQHNTNSFLYGLIQTGELRICPGIRITADEYYSGAYTIHIDLGNSLLECQSFTGLKQLVQETMVRFAMLNNCNKYFLIPLSDRERVLPSGKEVYVDELAAEMDSFKGTGC